MVEKKTDEELEIAIELAITEFCASKYAQTYFKEEKFAGLNLAKCREIGFEGLTANEKVLFSSKSKAPYRWAVSKEAIINFNANVAIAEDYTYKTTYTLNVLGVDVFEVESFTKETNCLKKDTTGGIFLCNASNDQEVIAGLLDIRPIEKLSSEEKQSLLMEKLLTSVIDKVALK